MVNGCCISFAGLNQRYGSQCFNDPRNAGKHRQPDAADALVSSEYGKSDAAHTVDEHRQPDAADALEVVRAGSA